MSVLSPAEGYQKMVKYGDHKAHLTLNRLAFQAFMAGLWVAVYGHCCTSIASLFYNPNDPHAPDRLARVVYGSLFPGAFVAVALTGTELYTGNTVAMSVYTLNSLRQDDFGKKLFSSLRVLFVALIGNYAGAAFGAFVLSYASNVFSSGASRTFLFAMAKHKTHGGFLSKLTLAIGCNMLVCLATWTTLIIGEGSGKILGMWFTVAVFAMGGFEHIVANFYTLTLAIMVDSAEFTLGNVVLKNWIPVLLGNTLAGVVFTGFPWWFALSPLPDYHYAWKKRESSEVSLKECEPLTTSL